MKTKNMTFTAMAAVILALCAWIKIPAAVPFTLQTFGIFLVLNLLGGKRGTLSILVYILLGAVGIPVFAGFTGGPAVLFGSTGGYILGFLLCGVVYWLAEKLPVLGKLRFLAANVLGLVLCYGFGSWWFMLVAAKGGTVYSFGAVISMCVVPFILPDCIKLGVAWAVGKRMQAALKGIIPIQ